MDFSTMTMSELDARLVEIRTLLDGEGADINALTAEVDAIEARKKEIFEQEKAAAELRKKVANGEVGTTIGNVIPQEDKTMGENRMTVESAEYRDAFYAMLRGTATEEQRTALINVDGDGSTAGDAIAIPKTLDTMIWDNIHTAHPVLNDITVINTGIVLEVTKHTAITAGKAVGKKDKVSNATAGVEAEDNTFVKVQLVGKDYAKYVELTYAEAKMSQGALEKYLADEISADLGEALAKDVFAQMISDAGANASTKGSNGWFATLADGLGKAEHAVNPVIYVTAANYYGIFGEVDANGQPIFRDGVAIGATVKIDSAVPSTSLAVVVDPAKFVLNQIQGILIESDRDVKEHKICISGYTRAQGCMRDNAAVSVINA